MTPPETAELLDLRGQPVPEQMQEPSGAVPPPPRQAFEYPRHPVPRQMLLHDRFGNDVIGEAFKRNGYDFA